MKMQRVKIFGIVLLACIKFGLVAQAESEQPYRADWRSLATHQIPEWLADEKYGIFVHWLPNSVPAYNDEWYARHMYKTGNHYFLHHQENWGDHKEFGYIDFIPMFKAEKWDPVEWVDFFKDNGARFVVPNAEHHCHFAMWDSDLTEWDAVEKGPKRDIVGELGAATRAAGLKYGVSNHRARGWNFYIYKPEFDTTDPEHADFYWPQYGKEPDTAWLEDWQARLHELVDKYQPDLMWFDFGWGSPEFEPYKKDYAAYYYNQAAAWDKEVALIYKGDNLPKGVGVLDVERGKLDRLWPELWMTDTTVFENTWGYVKDAKMKTVDKLLHDLIDIVSKNGTLLLNVGPKPDGTIPEDQRAVLRGIGDWLKINGEAIYKTRPFMIDHDGEKVRYTRNGKTVYATYIERPDAEETLTQMSIGKLGGLAVTSVSFVDGGAALEYSHTEEGLILKFPETLPGVRAWAIKVELAGIGFDKPEVRVEHRVEGAAIFAYSRVHNFTDEVQQLDCRLFVNNRKLRNLSRVRLQPGESGDVRFEHRDQNHYGATGLLLTDLSEGIFNFAVGEQKPQSAVKQMAFPSVAMVDGWKFMGGDDALWSTFDFDDSEWKNARVPGEWPLGRTANQTGWYRKTVNIPASWEGKDLYMNLGVIFDSDVVWVNGEKVGEKEYEEVEFHFAHEIRKFNIPASAIRYGEDNVVAVKVSNHGVKGGLVGPPGFITVAE